MNVELESLLDNLVKTSLIAKSDILSTQGIVPGTVSNRRRSSTLLGELNDANNQLSTMANNKQRRASLFKMPKSSTPVSADNESLRNGKRHSVFLQKKQKEKFFVRPFILKKVVMDPSISRNIQNYLSTADVKAFKEAFSRIQIVPQQLISNKSVSTAMENVMEAITSKVEHFENDRRNYVMKLIHLRKLKTSMTSLRNKEHILTLWNARNTDGGFVCGARLRYEFWKRRAQLVDSYLNRKQLFSVRQLREGFDQESEKESIRKRYHNDVLIIINQYKKSIQFGKENVHRHELIRQNVLQDLRNSTMSFLSFLSPPYSASTVSSTTGTAATATVAAPLGSNSIIDESLKSEAAFYQGVGGTDRMEQEIQARQLIQQIDKKIQESEDDLKDHFHKKIITSDDHVTSDYSHFLSSYPSISGTPKNSTSVDINGFDGLLELEYEAMNNRGKEFVEETMAMHRRCQGLIKQNIQDSKKRYKDEVAKMVSIVNR